MQRFLRARKLWKHITGAEQPLHFSETNEDDEDYDSRHDKYQSQLEEWDSVNSKIITWFSNTSISSIHSLFTPFEAAKEASFLYRHHLPTVGQALVELKSEETRKKTMVYQHSQPVLATPSWAPLPPLSQPVRSTSSSSQKKYCNFCRRDTHSYEECRSRSKSKRKSHYNRQNATVTDSIGLSDSISSTLTTADVETIVAQVLSRTNIHSSAFSTTSGSVSSSSRTMDIPNASPPAAPPFAPSPLLVPPE
ncbi:hypothetical protein Acr_00g0067400 [Actinidia rufa]|uniref:Uncharacterized protein n=1 Tax=Actinidia rufa TaxID=165716 RepID=A0A7J0DQE2_9ERIC|nr:hypothetical protein Acr_00g0067400 [Actinidia rufa]